MKRERAGRVFQLHGGDVALDLVNTLDWRFRAGEPEELLASYTDLVGYAEQAGVVTAREARGLMREADETAAQRTLKAARVLREALAEVLYAQIDGRKPAAAAVERLEKAIREARAGMALRWGTDGAAWVETGEAGPELPVVRLALRAEALVTGEALAQMRACGDPECRWLFLDTSKNHTRRWCNMQVCGNRMKARRFKALHAAD